MSFSSGNSLALLVESMIKTIDDTRRNATKVPVDTSSFLTMAFYLGELRDVITQLNIKRDAKSSEALSGMQRLSSALEDLKVVTKVSSERSRLFLIFDTEKLVSDLQQMVQEVGHDLNLMPVLSLMSSLSGEASNKLTDLRGRMRLATFDSEPEILEMAKAIEDGVSRNDKKAATLLVERILKHFGMTSCEADILKEEVQRDLILAEKEEKWPDVEKLTDLKTLMSLAKISNEAPITQAFSKLSLKVREDLALHIPTHFKCSLSGEVMRDPVMLVESKETYDRNAIENWFAKGNRTDPKTGKNLRNFEIVPNASLRKSIEEDYDHLNQNTLAEALRILETNDEEHLDDSLDAMHQLTSISAKYSLKLVEIGAIIPLVKLVSRSDAGNERERGLAVLKNLARIGEQAQSAIVEAGMVGTLIKIFMEDSRDALPATQLIQELSQCVALRQPIVDEMGIVELIKLLNKHSEDQLGELISDVLEMYWRDDPYVAIQMASVGMFKPLVELLGPGNEMETRMMMADGVMTWGVNKASRITLVQNGVLPPLVDLLNNGPPQGKAAAARSIEHLSHTEINRVALAKAGVIPALVKALSRGSPEVKGAAQATLANLAMDDQDLDALDEDGTAVRLITMLRAGPASNRDYAVRTLECMVRESKSMRASVVEDDGAVPAIFEVLQEGSGHFAAGSLRSSTLLLLSHLCQEPSAHEIMVAPAEVVKTLATLLNRPIPQEEREAIVIIMGAMAGNKQMRPLVREEEQVLVLMQRFLQSGSPKMQEAVMKGFSKLADPDDIEAQEAVCRLSIISTAVNYVRMGPDLMRIPSALLLGNLSLNTHKFSERLAGDRKLGKALSWKMSFNKSASSPQKDKLRSCRVHGGKCSLEATYCLVEGEVAGVLLELVKRGEDKVAEVCLAALASLLTNDEDQEKAADYLVRLDTIGVAASVVGRNKNLTKWAVYVLERIFHFKKYRQQRYAQPAITALGRFMTTATGPARKTAAETLMRLNILPKGSLSSDL